MIVVDGKWYNLMNFSDFATEVMRLNWSTASWVCKVLSNDHSFNWANTNANKIGLFEHVMHP